MLSARRRDLPVAHGLLIVLCLAGLLVVVTLGSRLTFFNDDWYFLLQRPGLESGGGLDAVLAPHNGEIVLLVALLLKALVAVFGLGWQLPFRLAIGVTVAALGGLVYALVAKRLGPTAGLAAAAVVLFLGPAWEVLLFFTAAFTHLGALTLGVGALLALESDTRRRNAVACLLLVCATLLFSLGITFVVAAVVVVALRRRPSQLWIAGLPAGLFAAWWIGYGSRQPSAVTSANLEHLPRYVVDSIAYGLASVTGLNHGSASATLGRGHVIGALAVVALAIWLLRGGRPTGWCLVLGAAALSWWVLAGAAYIVGRGPEASRYQLTDAVLLILLGAELMRGAHLGRAVRWGLALATVLVVLSNLSALRSGYDFMQGHAGLVKADLGALEVARPLRPANVWLLAAVARDPYLSGVTTGRYYAQTRAHDTPAFDSPVQLAGDPPADQQAADSVLAAVERIAPRPAAAATPATACHRLVVDGTGPSPPWPLRVGSTVVRNLSAVPLVIGVSRFGPGELPDNVGFLGAGSRAVLDVPRDGLSRPWRLSLGNPRHAPGVSATACRSGS